MNISARPNTYECQYQPGLYSLTYISQLRDDRIRRNPRNIGHDIRGRHGRMLLERGGRIRHVHLGRVVAKVVHQRSQEQSIQLAMVGRSFID